MTTWERARRLLLCHVKTLQQLNPEVLVDHVVHVLPVCRDGWVRAQLAFKHHDFFTQYVPWDSDFPSVPSLHHDMVIPTDPLKTSMMPITYPKASVTTPLVLKNDD